MQQSNLCCKNSVCGDPCEVSPTSNVGVFDMEILDILKVRSTKVFNNKRKGFLVITEPKPNPFSEFDLN
jgi:hypothetical protein